MNTSYKNYLILELPTFNRYLNIAGIYDNNFSDMTNIKKNILIAVVSQYKSRYMFLIIAEKF